MAIGLDDLNDDVRDEAGETPPLATATAEDTLLEGKPHDLQVKIMKAIAKRGLDPNDPVLEIYHCTGMAAEAASAAGAAAQAVRAGVATIPDQIFQGSGRAADEVKAALVQGGALFAQAFTKAANDRQAALVTLAADQQKSILDAASLGAEKIKTAAGTLTASLDKAVEVKKDQGVADFAKAAALAGERAAKGSMAAQMSRSAMLSIMAFLVAALIGAGGLWGWLLITHRVMPTGVVAMSDPLRGGTLVLVPPGGKPIRDCPAGLCLIYSSKLPDLP